jgi:hypothetical protein
MTQVLRDLVANRVESICSKGIQVWKRRSTTLESVALDGLENGVQAFEIWREDEIDCILMRNTFTTLDKELQ